MCLDLIEIWHQRARPHPSASHLGIQLGCHVEEFVEMLESLEPTLAVTEAIKTAKHLADLWKSGTHYPVIADRKEFLDSLADQVVTAVGAGQCAGMKVTEACRRVNTSNWSKFDNDGNPIFNEQGKIAKGPNYKKPDLEGLY